MKSIRTLVHKGMAKRFLLIFAILVVLFFIFNDLVMPWYVAQRGEVSVPSVVGKSFEDAKQILSSVGLDPREGDVIPDPKYPTGTVISQNPVETKIVRKGRRVYLSLSGGDRHVSVPTLRGRTLRDAKFQLEQEGLRMGKIVYEGNDTLPENTIISQTVSPRLSVKQGSSVGVIVSRGRVSDKLPAPDLLKKSFKEAEEILASLGLKVGNITPQTVPDVLPNTVVDQFPRPGEMVPNGGTIDLFISQEGEIEKELEEN